jgi:DNA invertase Pin-like site-specific DNA recombinase
MALIGYARVSTAEQHPHLQQDALKTAGCLKIFTDTISGVKSVRYRLSEALEYIRDGDTLVVWRLDRLGRSLKDLIERITALHSRNIGFKSLTENIDTTTSGGKLIFHIGHV